jgi:hypothetical protein
MGHTATQAQQIIAAAQQQQQHGSSRSKKAAAPCLPLTRRCLHVWQPCGQTAALQLGYANAALGQHLQQQRHRHADRQSHVFRQAVSMLPYCLGLVFGIIPRHSTVHLSASQKGRNMKFSHSALQQLQPTHHPQPRLTHQAGSFAACFLRRAVPQRSAPAARLSAGRPGSAAATPLQPHAAAARPSRGL